MLRLTGYTAGLVLSSSSIFLISIPFSDNFRFRNIRVIKLKILYGSCLGSFRFSFNNPIDIIFFFVINLQSYHPT